jgi:hypothetical protein
VHQLVRGPHDRARRNPATTMRRHPFARSDIRRKVSHTEASDVAADLLSIDYRAVPQPIVAHWTFNRKFLGVSVYYDEHKLALRH